MGDFTTVLDDSAARHLLRRTGFGATEALINGPNGYSGMTRGAAADRLLNFSPSKFKPLGRDPDDRLVSWVRYMLSTQKQLQEKLVLFWHDHFANSAGKVSTKLMGTQNALFRKFCKGNFKDMVKALNKDPAMLEFLDTVRNHKDDPNENYARELQELFTLGAKDITGQANYEQADIVQIAKGFSGWSYSEHKGKVTTVFDENDHDSTTPKTIYTSPGGFGAGGRDITANGEGQAEIDTIIDIIFDHRDSNGKSTVARFVTSKLLLYFAQPGVKRPVSAALAPAIDGIISRSSFDVNSDLSRLLREMFVDDSFYETAAAPPTVATKRAVKWPVDFVVSTLRMLKMRLGSKFADVRGGDYRRISDHLSDMGQFLFEPPSVFGWDWDTAWLSSATLLARYSFVRDVTAAHHGGITGFRPQRFNVTVNNSTVKLISLTDPVEIVNAVLTLLGIEDQFASSDLDVFINYLTDHTPITSHDPSPPTVSLQDENFRNKKLNGLFALAMQSSAYLLH